MKGKAALLGQTPIGLHPPHGPGGPGTGEGFPVRNAGFRENDESRRPSSAPSIARGGARPVPPWRLRSAGQWLRSAPGRLQYAVSRRLDAKPAELIAAALLHARRHHRSGVCLAASFPLSGGEVAALAREPEISGIVGKLSPTELPQLQQQMPDANLGAYWEPGRWILPAGASHIYFVGSWRLISLAMLREALRQNIVTLSARCGREWIDLPLGLIRFAAAGRRVLPPIIRRWAGPFLGGRKTRVAGAAIPARPLDRDMLHDMFRAAGRDRAGEFVPGRVVIVCGSLQPGGAERQVVHTASGVAAAAGVEGVSVLCDLLSPNHPARYDFYLSSLQRAGVPVRTVARRAVERGMVEKPAALARIRNSFPEGLLIDVANVYDELIRLRPEVVHAWLDWSNTRAGLAAALAGVPKIILSGRNLNPTNFALYQDYMDPVYKALCELPNVTLLNNSRAGAASYAEWLGLPPEHIQVLYNGLDAGGETDGDPISLRADLGIPANALLLGGAFRLYPEKRPLLWIEVAARVARSHPDAWFVMFGDGILKADVEKAARAGGIAHRLVMPGVSWDLFTAMRAMDVFLLTSYGEGVPNVLMEAQAAETPVVATRAGGAEEAVDPGVSGWIVDPPDAGRLSERVTWLLGDRARRQRAGAAGRAFVRQRFGLERMIEETLEVYGFADSSQKHPKVEPCR